MARRRSTRGSGWLEQSARAVTAWTGRSQAFAGAVGVVLVWAALGPVFGFSDTWQLVINTGTTIVTFLMVFLIQRSQNKDSQALHLKLNEIVAALQGASNRLINVEDLTEQEVETLHRHYQKLAELARRDSTLTASHSVEEAETRSAAKKRGR
ncbi:MAG: low affinity iron permease family protein [Candidatus Rokuibacteriota bacterium]